MSASCRVEGYVLESQPKQGKDPGALELQTPHANILRYSWRFLKQSRIAAIRVHRGTENRGAAFLHMHSAKTQKLTLSPGPGRSGRIRPRPAARPRARPGARTLGEFCHFFTQFKQNPMLPWKSSQFRSSSRAQGPVPSSPGRQAVRQCLGCPG